MITGPKSCLGMIMVVVMMMMMMKMMMMLTVPWMTMGLLPTPFQVGCEPVGGCCYCIVSFVGDTTCNL
jgi:hypothetical protein